MDSFEWWLTLCKPPRDGGYSAGDVFCCFLISDVCVLYVAWVAPHFCLESNNVKGLIVFRFVDFLLSLRALGYGGYVSWESYDFLTDRKLRSIDDVKNVLSESGSSHFQDGELWHWKERAAVDLVFWFLNWASKDVFKIPN